MSHADLFGGLNVKTPTGTTPASRVDVGWAAWRSAQPEAGAERRVRWRFWWALWRHFGQARFFVHIDNSYHTATSVRVRLLPETGELEVLLVQSDSLWQLLLGLRRTQKARQTTTSVEPSLHGHAMRKRVLGHQVSISRYPDTLAAPSLPKVSHIAGQERACPEVTLDLQRQALLPLEIRSSH